MKKKTSFLFFILIVLPPLQLISVKGYNAEIHYPQTTNFSVKNHYSLTIQMENQWNTTFGGTGNDGAVSLIQTSDGGLTLGAWTASYGAGESDMWLVRTDSNGQHGWNTTFGGTENDVAFSLIQTSDGGYALVGFTFSYGAGGSDIWLVKTDNNGQHQWNTTFGGIEDDDASSVIQTSDGGYAVLGETHYDFWLVKTDSDGRHEWNTTFGGTSNEYAVSLIQTDDSGYVLAGYTGSFGAGWHDLWLVKTDSNGQHEWNTTFGGTEDEYGGFLIQTSEGGFAVVGFTYSYGAGSSDIWLVKTDSNGQYEWDTTFGGRDAETALSVIQTSDDGYIIAGNTWSYGAGGFDIWLVRTGTNGKGKWDRTFGGSEDDFAWSLIQTSDGGFMIVGGTYSYGAGGSDIWLVKLYDLDNATTPGFTYFCFIATLFLIPLINHKQRKRKKGDYFEK